MSIDNLIINNLEEQISTINKLKQNKQVIEEIYQKIKNARNNNNKIFVMGNGGSSSTASHFVSDLLKTSLIKGVNRPKAISLTDNIPVLMAWANDTEFKNIFANQLENFLEKDDIVIGISGSGNSENVVKAIEFANKTEAKTICLLGRDGGELAKISQTNLIIPNEDMLTIETMHLLVCHLITALLRLEGKPVFSY
ncbi:Phosphoheptose isomerase protein [Marine Group I thaumarchaeote SCGC AAA799-P11]|uniref:Phosphoheptose isomerase protein n=1 Tax=Marine Group I thaumarchaeote SCGC AAA799-P11 TaxID=1502295 RepID=A0A087S2Y3_9ARCH|nr:Phosphoheptose isomerase protein [Marine Group I thaumarchaeote SCGC AAA799-P11]